MLTYHELERAAYMSGNTTQAEMMGTLATYDDANDALGFGYTLDFTIQDQIDAETDKEIAKKCPDYDAYKQFFEDCFYRLNGHYPAPSVTSDYDCSVIFDAIEKGSK